MRTKPIDLRFTDADGQRRVAHASVDDGGGWILQAELAHGPFRQHCSDWHRVERMLRQLRQYDAHGSGVTAAAQPSAVGAANARSLVVWLAILALAVMNGVLRQSVLVPRVGVAQAHMLITAVLCGAVLLVTAIAIGWLAPATATAADAWKIGLSWVALTVGFEFLAGHFLFGSSWEQLLADYNVQQGRVWILVLVTTVVAPRVMMSLRLGR